MLARLAERSDAPDPASLSLPQPGGGFARNVMAFLDRVEYRRCDKGEDLEAIYRLRYKSYLATGMVGPNRSRTVTDALDDLENCMRFGVFVDGELASTLRLHHVSAEHTLSPSTTVYGDLLMPRIAHGETFIDPSRFAADPAWSAQITILPYITLRLAAMACVHFSPDWCLSTIRPDHAAFYRRVFAAEQAGNLRSYPALNYQVVLYQAHYRRIAEQTGMRYPFFKSTPMEQRLMFGKAPAGELEPLTVLPTAKYMMQAA